MYVQFLFPPKDTVYFQLYIIIPYSERRRHLAV